MVNNTRGFSLIELVVVIGLLSLLLLAISSTSLMSVISSNRIRTATKVKQAGNYAIDQISGLLRSSKNITSCSSTEDSITFVNLDGGETTIYSEINKIASGSGLYLTPNNLSVTNFNLECLPDTITPTLIKLSFDLRDNIETSRPSSNPLLHFETSVNLRNQ
jgi:prepilin-type N-terminal cleavage/methylation domain-containing protein